MIIVGIAVSVETEGRPTARGAVLDDGSGSPVVVDTFELPGDDVDLPQQLRDLSKACSSRFAALSPDRVTVRRADFSPTPNRREAPKLRLMAEGVIAAAAREQVADTYLADGHQMAQWANTGKDDLEADAKKLAKASGLAVGKWTQAVFAALGGRSKA